MSTTTTTTTDQLAQLVRRRRRLLEQVLLLCGRQGQFVESGETTELLKVLGEKQRLIDQLRETERLLDPFRHQDPDARDWPSAEARAVCAADAQRCTDLLAAVRELEARHGDRMAERRDVIADQLRAIHRGHQVATAYGPHAPQVTPARPKSVAPNLAAAESPPSGGLDVSAG